MMLNPRIGQQVQIWYSAVRWPLYGRQLLPHQGKVGTVVLASRGRPRNHMVRVDGVMVVVPCGNIRRVP